MKDFKKLSMQEWEDIEREEHDEQYRDSLPFDSKDYRIDPEHVIWYEDYCYKKGRRRDRGHRTKRVFELMDIRHLHGKKVLDIGCGNGQYAVLFALLGAEAYGFDLSPVGVEVGKRMAAENGVLDNCHFSVQNAADMDYPDDFFDVVLFHEVLHHAIKYEGVREETYRIVKKGGLVICAEGLRGNALLKLGRFFTMRGQEAKGDTELTLKDLESFASDYREHKIELMSLLYMIKRVFRNYLEIAPVRWFLFLTKKLDDVLLSVFPPLRKYCGESVLVMKK